MAQTEASALIRSYGSPMLGIVRSEWPSVRAAVIRRERAQDLLQQFLIPRHVFRFGIAGQFGGGSISKVGDHPPVALSENKGRVDFYPADTLILNEVTSVSQLKYLTVECDPSHFLAFVETEVIQHDLSPLLNIKDELIFALLQNIVIEVETPDPLQRLFCEQSAIMLMLALTRRSARHCAQRKGGMSAAQLRRVTDFLIDHLTDPVSLTELVALTGLSASHLCRAFKQSTGLTPHRWQLTARVEQAKRHLVEKRLSLVQVALALGYAGQPSFTSSFRRVTGCSPGQWQREN